MMMYYIHRYGRNNKCVTYIAAYQTHAWVVRSYGYKGKKFIWTARDFQMANEIYCQQDTSNQNIRTLPSYMKYVHL